MELDYTVIEAAGATLRNAARHLEGTPQPGADDLTAGQQAALINALRRADRELSHAMATITNATGDPRGAEVNGRMAMSRARHGEPVS